MNDGAEQEEPGRLRLGFDVFGGVGTGGNLSGPAFGGRFRIGWQINRMFGAYYQVSPYVWVGGSDAANASSVSIGAVTGVPNTVLGSISPVDIVEIAAGPSLDYVSGGGASAGPNSASANAFSSVYFALHGRVALHLGGRNAETGRRRGFTIAADIHPTFAEGSTLTFMTVGLGADWL